MNVLRVSYMTRAKTQVKINHTKEKTHNKNLKIKIRTFEVNNKYSHNHLFKHFIKSN